MIEFSITSLLLDHGASMTKPGSMSHCQRLKEKYSTRKAASIFIFHFHPSYLSYLIPLTNPLTHFRAELFKYLDIDGISELTHLDRWLTSVLYHTSTEFKKSLLAGLEMIKQDLLPKGLLEIHEVCKELRTANAYDQGTFYLQIATLGSTSILRRSVGAEFDPTAQILVSLAAGNICIKDFRVVMQLMSSFLVLERVQDHDFLERFFELWAPSAELRPLVAARWFENLRSIPQSGLRIGDSHHAMFDALIDRGYCSFPGTTSFLGIEFSWQVCLALVSLRFYMPCETDWNPELIRYMVEHYRPFVDLELNRQWLPTYWKERWLGYTPLMLAVVVGHLELVKVLVDNGATLTQPHGSQQLSVIDLSFRNLASHHPRNWMGLSPSELRLWTEDNHAACSHAVISEETDSRIHVFLMGRSKQSHHPSPVANRERISGGESILLPSLSACADSCMAKTCFTFWRI